MNVIFSTNCRCLLNILMWNSWDLLLLPSSFSSLSFSSSSSFSFHMEFSHWMIEEVGKASNNSYFTRHHWASETMRYRQKFHYHSEEEEEEGREENKMEKLTSYVTLQSTQKLKSVRVHFYRIFQLDVILCACVVVFLPFYFHSQFSSYFNIIIHGKHYFIILCYYSCSPFTVGPFPFRNRHFIYANI